MSDIRCPVCNAMLGRRQSDGSVELKEKNRLVARIKWGRLGCSRCGKEVALDIIPASLGTQQDVWEVVGPTNKP